MKIDELIVELQRLAERDRRCEHPVRYLSRNDETVYNRGRTDGKTLLARHLLKEFLVKE